MSLAHARVPRMFVPRPGETLGSPTAVPLGPAQPSEACEDDKARRSCEATVGCVAEHELSEPTKY